MLGEALAPATASVVAISGTTYAQRSATAASRVFALSRNSALPLLVDMGGPSDLLTDMAAADVLAAMIAYHDAARASGVRVTVASTVTSMTAAPWGWTPAMEAQRLALNDLIRASDRFDAVADIALIPEAADPADVAWFSDGLHPTAALAALIVDELARAGRDAIA